MIYGIVLFVITLAIDLATDYRRWLRRTAVNHTRGVWLRLIGLIPAGVLLSVAEGQIQPQIWAVPSAMFFTYWVLFNGIFALLIGQNWGYVGDTSAMDRWERKNRWFGPVKYILAIGFNILYLIL